MGLNESTKGSAWLSLWDTSPWRAMNSECGVWRNQYFVFLPAMPLLKPWFDMIEQSDTTQPAVVLSELSEAVKE